MTEASTAFQRAFNDDLPVAAAKPWAGFPPYYFVGGNNAPEAVPVAEITRAMTAVLDREGPTLATYHLESGPQGYRPLREYLAQKLARDCAMQVTPDEILLVSGSLQGIDLINAAMIKKGDTVIIEAENYGGVFSRLRRLQVNMVPVPTDADGMRLDALAETLANLKAQGITPKYIYTIPTVQNPTASVMPEDRRREMVRLAADYDVPIFEDDCYADLTWDGTRPPAVYACDNGGRTVYLGTFSKSIAPALRVGFVVAPWPVLARLLPLKTDAGSGALEQMMLAEYCPEHFDAHVVNQRRILKEKLDHLVECLAASFGTSAEFDPPKGGIFLWVKLPENVDTARLAKAAAAEGVIVNAGPEWSIAPDAARHIRICFAKATKDNMRAGIEKLAEICHREFGVPQRSANVAR